MTPTVHTYDGEGLPILVTLTDADIQPDATVAPAGRVRFTVMNKGDRPHDFLILRTGNDGQDAKPTTPTYSLPATGPGGSADLDVELEPGTYMIASSDIASSDARAQITVQPAETDHATPEAHDPPDGDHGEDDEDDRKEQARSA